MTWSSLAFAEANLFTDLVLGKYRVTTGCRNQRQGRYPQHALRPRGSQDERRRPWHHAIECHHELTQAANVEARHTAVKKHGSRKVALAVIIPVHGTPALTVLPDRRVLHMASERRLFASCSLAVDVCSQIVHCQLCALRTVIASHKVGRPRYRVH